VYNSSKSHLVAHLHLIVISKVNNMTFKAGTLVTITSSCNSGSLVVRADGSVCTSLSIAGTRFHIESPDASLGDRKNNEGYILLRDISTNYYLTAPPCGEKGEVAIRKALLEATPIVPDLISAILEYTGSAQRNSYYCPVFARCGPPGVSNLFHIDESKRHSSMLGIRAQLGAYLRAPAWSSNVYQMPQLNADEHFSICVKAHQHCGFQQSAVQQSTI
jgi:hypothetical protein